MIRENIPTLLQEKKHARICDQSENKYRQIERVLKPHGDGFRKALPAFIKSSEDGVLRINEFILSDKNNNLPLPPDRIPHPAHTIDFELSSRPGPHAVRLSGSKDRYISIYPGYLDRLIHMNRSAGM